jgi:outer membrane protein OmpA-like peptidoglycan-associated protein
MAARELAPKGATDGPRKIVLASDIFIVPGSNQLAAGASVPLDQAAQLLRQSSGLVRIIGHMDATGNPDSNRQLSLRRAQAVRDYLVSTYRFDPARFTVEGRGSDEPVASNDTAAGRHANRRVELLLSE